MPDEQKPETNDRDVEHEPQANDRVDEQKAKAANRAVEQAIAHKTRRSLLVGGVAALGGFGLWDWISTRRPDNDAAWPLRRVLDINEELARDYFRIPRKPTELPVSKAVENVRVNAHIGMDDPLDPKEWQLVVEGSDVDDDQVVLHMSDIRKLPHVEQVTELNCIEGWTQEVYWGGARFADFAKLYPPPEDYPYVGLETPDGEYYVGLDLASAMQPQTLLAYEMNQQPLTEAHGAPLRLAIPTKYGIKNLKRIGKIFYSQERPKDYWGEQGYDWYAGL